MKFKFLNTFLVVVLTMTLLGQKAIADTFDGTWSVTLKVPDNKDATGVVARGYVFHFPAEVKNGDLHGERGNRGVAGWFEINGKIEPDGTAVLHADGITGAEEYNLFDGTAGTAHTRSGKPYKYTVNAHFKGQRGTGKRMMGRIAYADFVKN
jgi:hypothetical protein